LRAAFDSFVEHPGVPFVQVEKSCAKGHATLTVTQSRYLPLGSAASTQQQWALPFCARYATRQSEHVQCALLTQPTNRIELEGSACPSFVMPNAHASGYYRFALAAKDQRALAAAFGRLDAREQRVYADSLAAAFNNGTIGVREYLDGVAPVARSASR